MAVAATKYALLFLLCLITSFAQAAILPEERADALYHSYEGGGVKIDGPSVLVRKNVGDKFSFYGNYYVDMVTSASIDVLVRASEYTEERTEYSLGMDYLNDRTIIGVSYTSSSENDYEASTVGFNISQEFFGDLSTITMGFALGDDTVRSSEAENFEDSAGRKRYNIGFSQILTKKFIASLSYETVIDEGFLRNPYRSVRIVENDLSTETDFTFLTATQNDLFCEKSSSNVGGECYPETRNSEAFAIRGIYALTPTTSIRGEYRIFSDSWGVESNNIELRLAKEFGGQWLTEFRFRQYTQDKAADFYQDIFDFSTRPEFYARDKELSEYTSTQYGIGVTYTFKSRYEFFNNSKLSFNWDYMSFDYDSFRDATNGSTASEQSLYSFEADVIRIFYSAFF